MKLQRLSEQLGESELSFQNYMKHTYRTQILPKHPDKAYARGSPEEAKDFDEILAAYKTLIDLGTWTEYYDGWIAWRHQKADERFLRPVETTAEP